jgi:hypothetical protein
MSGFWSPNKSAEAKIEFDREGEKGLKGYKVG